MAFWPYCPGGTYADVEGAAVCSVAVAGFYATNSPRRLAGARSLASSEEDSQSHQVASLSVGVERSDKFGHDKADGMIRHLKIPGCGVRSPRPLSCERRQHAIAAIQAKNARRSGPSRIT